MGGRGSPDCAAFRAVMAQDAAETFGKHRAPSPPGSDQGTAINPILQVRKLRQQEVKSGAQAHNWQVRVLGGAGIPTQVVACTFSSAFSVGLWVSGSGLGLLETSCRGQGQDSWRGAGSFPNPLLACDSTLGQEVGQGEGGSGGQLEDAGSKKWASGESPPPAGGKRFHPDERSRSVAGYSASSTGSRDLRLLLNVSVASMPL